MVTAKDGVLSTFKSILKNPFLKKSSEKLLELNLAKNH